MTDLFTLTRRPDSALFFARGEAGDPRLGEIVRHHPDDYPAARIVLLGCPQDEGVRRNGGRVGAAHAPAEIRRYLYRLVAGDGWEGRFFDLGDTLVQPTLEHTHATHQQVVEHALRDGKTVIVLGGGNDISYPDACAMQVARAGQPFIAVNVDAHLDVRLAPQRHSGTPYRQLLDEGRLSPSSFYQVGTQLFSTAQAHLRYVREAGAHLIPLEQLRAADLPTLPMFEAARRAGAAFWGFDVDVVTAADAPGVSAPNPSGLSAHDFLRLCALAAGQGASPLLLEFSEVNPTYDLDGRTCRLVAAAIWHILHTQLSSPETA
jgi:formiminoglutamase